MPRLSLGLDGLWLAQKRAIPRQIHPQDAALQETENPDEARSVFCLCQVRVYPKPAQRMFAIG